MVWPAQTIFFRKRDSDGEKRKLVFQAVRTQTEVIISRGYSTESSDRAFDGCGSLITTYE